MDICGLNAQGLRGQRIREELWGPLTPAPRVARRLSVLKINRHVTAERSQVCRINSLALNYGPSFLGLFSNNNTFEGDSVRNHFGDTKREPRAAGCQLPVSPTSPGHEGRMQNAPSVCSWFFCVLMHFSLSGRVLNCTEEDGSGFGTYPSPTYHNEAA